VIAAGAAREVRLQRQVKPPSKIAEPARLFSGFVPV
jgi:hypothetical protein